MQTIKHCIGKIVYYIMLALPKSFAHSKVKGQVNTYRETALLSFLWSIAMWSMK